jgi:hypothetical protein
VVVPQIEDDRVNVRQEAHCRNSHFRTGVRIDEGVELYVADVIRVPLDFVERAIFALRVRWLAPPLLPFPPATAACT